MKNVKEKMFVMAAIDFLSRGEEYNKIELDGYNLEYRASEEERVSMAMDEGGIPSLMLQVKLRNQKTNNVEWSEIYYKTLGKYSFDDLLTLSQQEKMDFIFKPENKMTGSLYKKSIFVPSSEFFAEFPKKIDVYDYPNIQMPHKLTREAKAKIALYQLPVETNKKNSK